MIKTGDFMKPHSVSKKKSNKILETVHDSVSGFHRAGLVDSKKMAEFDALCSQPSKIKKLRSKPDA